MIPSRVFDTITVEEYLEAENDGTIRHEYVYGELYAMAGASVSHNLINVIITTALKIASQSTKCRVYASDMKVRVKKEIFYYPDVMIACQDIKDNFFENDACVIVEIMSPTTARNDLLEKRFAYMKLESLQLYSLIDRRKQWVKAYKRSGSQWQELSLSIRENFRNFPHFSSIDARRYL